MFRIKICGITTPEDARAACAAGADAVGINFYAGSPRCVDEQHAREIVAAIDADTARVGVFVNHASDEMLRLREQLSLTPLQLHGAASPSQVAALDGAACIVARRPAADGLDETIRFVEDCRRQGAQIESMLVDARVEGSYGGTGQTANWELAARLAAHPELPPLVLAGGLTAENVADAVARVQPAAVDVAGGVEDRPGRKSAGEMERFVAAARAAFAKLDAAAGAE